MEQMYSVTFQGGGRKGGGEAGGGGGGDDGERERGSFQPEAECPSAAARIFTHIPAEGVCQQHERRTDQTDQSIMMT